MSGRPVFDRDSKRALHEAPTSLELAAAAGHFATWSFDPLQRRLRADVCNLPPGYRLDAEHWWPHEEWQRHVHPEDRERIEDCLRKALDARSPCSEVEFRLPVQDGSWHWFLARGGITQRLADGTPSRLDGILVDIDRRRRAEEALQASELRYRAVTALNPGYVYEAVLGDDDSWALIWISDGAREVYGCAPEEIVALGLDRFRMRNATLLRDDRVRRCRNGESIQFDTSIQDVHGLVHWLRIASRAVGPASTGSGLRIVGVAHDITDQKRLEREILEITHREQERIGNDLHDGLGQELTGASMLLREITRRFTAEAPQVSARIEDVIGLLNDAIGSVRLLARGLSPVALLGGSLVDALHELGTNATARFGLSVTIRSRVENSIEVNQGTALHLYRIAQEAISNAARHGQATRLRITLSHGGRKPRMSISDNGIGMPRSGGGATSGMGLKIMAYRARMIGGEITIRGGPRGGVCVRCDYRSGTASADREWESG